MKRGMLVFIVGAIVVAGIVVLAIVLSQLRSSTSEPTSERVLPFVTTVAPTAHEGRVTIRGNGTVRPLREVTLVAATIRFAESRRGDGDFKGGMGTSGKSNGHRETDRQH